MLSDVGLLASARFGIVFELPPELQALYAAFGNELPVVNGDGTWRLPIPATYVIAPDGRIVLAGLDPDYRHRLDPEGVGWTRCGVLIGIPALGEIPSLTQWLGLALVTIGLLTALDVPRRMLFQRKLCLS